MAWHFCTNLIEFVGIDLFQIPFVGMMACFCLEDFLPTNTSKLSEKQKILLQQIDRVTACIDKVSKLSYLQKNDILDTLYNADMKQCIDKIIIHARSINKIKNAN